MTNTGKIATGVLVGAIVGTVLGILFAPKEGSKTRAIISDKAKELGTTAEQNYYKAKDLLGLHNEKEKELVMNN